MERLVTMPNALHVDSLSLISFLHLRKSAMSSVTLATSRRFLKQILQSQLNAVSVMILNNIDVKLALHVMPMMPIACLINTA